jgi:F-type H+-transporting ATPase subunit b
MIALILQSLFILTDTPEPWVFMLNSQTLIQVGSHLINVGLLAVILRFLLYKPVSKFMASRSENIAGQLSYAAEEMTKATELKALYEQKLQDIKAERDDILDAARKQAADTSRQILAEAKDEADSVRAKAQTNAAMEWERAQTEMKSAIIEVSAAMTAKFITQTMDDKTRDKLFAETVEELGSLSWRS